MSFSAQRSRHEAAWTHDDATVKGRRNRNGWWMLALVALLGVLVTVLAYNRYMNFQDVTFQLRQCEQPLEEGATWADVQAAACDPMPVDGDVLTVWVESDQRETTVSGDTFLLEKLAVNHPASAVELNLAEPARTVVLAEPETQQVRRHLTTDASDTMWTGMVGGRGPTEYWLLVTP